MKGIGPGGKTQRGRNGPPAESGFTLLEIVLVLVIIGLFVGLALPRLPDISGVEIQKSARKVAMTFQAARMRAVSLRRYYRVEVDVDANRILVSYFGPEGTYIEDDSVRSFDTGRTDIVDMVTSTRGRTREGIGWVHISPRGFIEPSFIHLRDSRDRNLTISPSPAGGRVRILEGYVDLGPG